MSKAEILERLITNLDREKHSIERQKQTDLYLGMYDELKSTLNERQQSFFFELDAVINTLNGYFFEDGIRYGFELANELKGILENPAIAFKEFEEASTPFEEMNASEIEALEEFKKNKPKAKNSDNLKAKIEQAVTTALNDYNFGGASA